MFIVIYIEGVRDIRFALNEEALTELLFEEARGFDEDLGFCRLARVPEDWPWGYGTLGFDSASRYFVICDGAITAREGVQLSPRQPEGACHERTSHHQDLDRRAA